MARLGEFRLLRQLGRGGMGAVHLAYSDTLGRYVAVKVMEAGRNGPEIRRRLELERRLLSGLHHPNIAQFLGGGQTSDGSPYVAMELIFGESLDEFCRVRDLDTDARIRLFCAVCDGVHYAHQSLIVHHDLKPDNVLVTHAGIPKLVDFGIAMANPLVSSAGSWGDGDGEVALMMTPEYASPEQVCGEPLTTATDIFSLGVMLYELLSGKRPYALSGLPRTEMARLISRRPSPPSTHVAGLGRDLDCIVGKAMAEQPTDRYASAQELANDLKRYLAGEPILARRSTIAYRLATLLRWRRRRLRAT